MVMELWWAYLTASLERRESQNMMRESDRGSCLTPSWCLCVCLHAWMCTKHFRAPINCVYHTDHPSITLHTWTSCALTHSWRGHTLLDVVSSQWFVTRNKVMRATSSRGFFYVMKAVSKCSFELYSMHSLRKDATLYNFRQVPNMLSRFTQNWGIDISDFKILSAFAIQLRKCEKRFQISSVNIKTKCKAGKLTKKYIYIKKIIPKKKEKK